jgi:hypothetical protein
VVLGGGKEYAAVEAMRPHCSNCATVEAMRPHCSTEA